MSARLDAPADVIELQDVGVLTDGLEALAGSLGHITEVGALATPLPLVGMATELPEGGDPAVQVSVGGALDLEGLIQRTLVQKVEDYLNYVDGSTFDDFTTFLQGLQLGDVSLDSQDFFLTVTSASHGFTEGDEVRFDVTFDVGRKVLRPLNVGETAVVESVDVSDPPDIPLTVTSTLGLQLGMKLDEDVAPGEAFFAGLGDFRVDASVDVQSEDSLEFSA